QETAMRVGQPAPLARITPAGSNAFGSQPLALTPLDDWLWEPVSCAVLLLEQFRARTLEGYGLQQQTEAIAAAGACLRYARETQREQVAHINDITYFEAQDHLILDAVTIRNLELTEAQHANRAHTLLGVIDATVTGMGARLLRAWLLRPSIKCGEIEARLSAVEHFHRSQQRRDHMQTLLNLSELGAIRDGYSTELDELRVVNRDAKQTIAALEARERARSGIASLRVRFNNVFGYFIEVSKASAARVPPDYERRQTLANAERYTTPELKDWEQRVRGAEERIRELEAQLFADVRARVAAETKRLQTTARALAMLDVLAALA